MRRKGSPYADHVVHAGSTCPVCGKVRFQSRKEAKRAVRVSNLKGLNAYRCGEFYHVGHAPRALKRGDIGRDEIQRRSFQGPDPR